jgi:hypothetical protein
MDSNAERPVKDMERGSDFVEEKTQYNHAEINKDDVGYQEYLESLDIEFSPKEERWVRWKLDVRYHNRSRKR